MGEHRFCMADVAGSIPVTSTSNICSVVFGGVKHLLVTSVWGFSQSGFQRVHLGTFLMSTFCLTGGARQSKCHESLAQLVEHRFYMPKVVGSSPARFTKQCCSAPLALLQKANRVITSGVGDSLSSTSTKQFLLCGVSRVQINVG